MTTVTQPLRDEHKDLLPHVDRILYAAEIVGEAGVIDVRNAVDETYDFLAGHLVPHARAEEAALYPVVQSVMGSPEATSTMSRDHVEVGQYVQELAVLRGTLTGSPLTPAQARSLRRVLYGVYALVKVHFAKEEEVYLPLLDRHLSPEAAQDMFEKMEAAAHAAKQAVHNI